MVLRSYTAYQNYSSLFAKCFKSYYMCLRKHVSAIPAYGEISWKKPTGLDTEIKMFNPLSNAKENLVLPWGQSLRWYFCS